MPVTKVVTEKFKAKEGSIEIEIIKEFEKGKDSYSLFNIKFGDQVVSLDDKDAKCFIKMFQSIFQEERQDRKRKDVRDEPKAAIPIPANVPKAEKQIVATDGVVKKEVRKGQTLGAGNTIQKMSYDAALALSGQRKEGNSVIDRINNRTDDGYVDPAFNEGMKSNRKRNSIIDKINSHSTV